MTENERELINIIRNAPDPEELIKEAFRLIAEQLQALSAAQGSLAERIPEAS